MKLNNKVYDVLKWLCLLGLPTLATLYATLAPLWGWPMAEEVTTTINAITVALGALIGVSTVAYNKSK